MNNIAIMQPTFLPWIGYFAMIDRVEDFVFLDSVQFSKRSWQQRNQIFSLNGPIWLTVPIISKGKSDQLIKDTKIDNSREWARKVHNSLTSSYSNTKFFKKYRGPIFESINQNIENISDLNINLIKVIMDQLGMNGTKFYRSSELSSEGSKAELLSNICVELGKNEYLSAPGSKEYISESRDFEQRSIEVKYHDYKHPEYDQGKKEFRSHLSIVDLLFNEGDKALEILRSGVVYE